MVRVVIHTNMQLPNQVETAGWLQTGFAKHGIKAEITPVKNKAADIHVIQGPWYCYNEWLKKSGNCRVLFLNRCFFGHPRFDISLGWLQPDGSRDFRNCGMAASNGLLPALKPEKDSRRCAVVFADYGEDMTAAVIDARARYDSVFFRPHPADSKRTSPVMTLPGELDAVWALADVAIGHKSTVLVEAKINGLQVETTDPLHVCNHAGSREQWLVDLSWANWNHATGLQSGTFWEHLC